MTHMFRIHVLPMDLVSDWGPQLTSQVRKIFAKSLGDLVSLTSGYHPQSNGQTERANQFLEFLETAVSPHPIRVPGAPACPGLSMRTIHSSAPLLGFYLSRPP